MDFEFFQTWDAWTREAILHLIESNAYEGSWFDFKEILIAPKGSDRDLLRIALQKSIAAMANSEGGFLIFGVADPAKNKRKAADELIVGIDMKPSLRKEFGDIAKGIQPPVAFDVIPAPIVVDSTANLGIFIAQIPRSASRPHMADWRFWRRGSGGQAIEMDYYEIRDQMRLNEERLRRVEASRLLIELFEVQVNGLEANRLHLSADRLNVSLLNNLMPDVIGLLPKTSNADHLLLKIAGLASQVNNVLDWAQNNKAVHPWSDNAFNNASRQLLDLIHQLSDELERVFGPGGRIT